MAFSIVLAPAAVRDIEDTLDFISEQSSLDAARRWKAGLYEAIDSLREMPNRGVIVPEAEDLGFSLRQYHHHSHRIIYRVNDDLERVDVLRIWHGARRRLRGYDFM